MAVWDDFIAAVEMENMLLQELIELSAAKQKQINDAQEVARLASEEQSRLTSLEQVDRTRASLFHVLAGGKKLEDWLETLSPGQQEVMNPLILELAQNLGSLQTLNDLNQELLAQSLSYVQFTLNVLVGDDTSPTYTRPGANAQGKSIFDRKV